MSAAPRRLGGLVSALLACNAKTSPQDTPPSAAPGPESQRVDAGQKPPPVGIEPHARYAGYVRLAHIDPSKNDDREALVIRDPSSLEAFIERIPKHRLQKRQPAPPSDDPLLERPAIDFDRHVVIVFVRGDTPWGAIEIEPIQREGDGVRIRRRHPPLPETGPMAQPMGIGTYVALVIDRFDGALTIDDD